MKKHPLDFPGSQAALIRWKNFKPSVVEILEEIPETRDFQLRFVPSGDYSWGDASHYRVTPIGPVAKALLKVRK